MILDRKAHWEKVYGEKGEQETSWFQPRPEISLALIEVSDEPLEASLIDVGGGASRLVDLLLARGWSNLSVLDISATALRTVQRRLGAKAKEVRWLEADLLEGVPGGPYRIWHDRAVFHFLTQPADRQRYLLALERSLAPGGTCIIAAFSPEGPERCSGLPVQRYSPAQLAETLGAGFELLDIREEQHRTPAGKVQSFVYCRFRRLG